MASKRKEYKRMAKKCKTAWAKYLSLYDKRPDVEAFVLPPTLD